MIDGALPAQTKECWCRGQIIRLVDGEAAEVSYLVPGSKKERQKLLRIDSPNLALDASSAQ